MKHSIRNIGSRRGFTLIELIVILALIFVLFSVAMPMFMGQWDERRRPENGNRMCELTDRQFSDFIGGVAVGTAVSSSIAGDSILIIATQTGVFLGTTPALAPAVSLVAISTAAGYTALKSYCGRHKANRQLQKWHRSAVDNASEGLEIVIETHGRLVNYASEAIEFIFNDGKKN
jgi:hypothetical protein